MGLRKDKRGISTEDSRPTPTLTPMTTTICPTVTSKMGPLVPKRKMKGLPEMMAPKCRAVRRAQSRKCLSPHLRKIRHDHHQMCVRFKMTTSEPQCPYICSKFLVNSYHRPENHLTRMGKVAIIRDVGAVTYVKSVVNWSSPLTGPVALRLCYISYTLGRSSLPHSVLTHAASSPHRQGLGIGVRGDHHLHQQSRFTDLPTW